MNRTACATDGSTAAAGGALNGAASAAAAGAAGAAVGLVAGASGEAPGSEPRSQGLAFGGAAGAAGAAIAAGAVGAAGAAIAAGAAGAVGAADAGSAAAIASRLPAREVIREEGGRGGKKRGTKAGALIPVRVVVPFTNAMQELPLYQSPPSHEKLQHATPALSYQHSDTHTHTDHPRPHPGQALPWTFDYFSSPARAVPRSQGEP